MKIGFLITARLKSSRLPFKIIKDLNGKTVIERVIDRAKEIKDISEIVLCTSTNPQDRPLVDIAKENDIYYFNGDEEDVLKRLLDAAKFFDLDYFLGTTADNPLITIHYSNLVVDEIKRNHYDFIKSKGLPLGAATYGMRCKALETVCKIKTIVNTEIWGYLVDRPEIFNVKTIKVEGKLNRPELRLTLDYNEDYKLINNIYSNVPFEKVLNLYDVIGYLDKNPEISKINKSCVQLDLNEKVKEEIDRNYKENLEEIKKIKRGVYGVQRVNSDCIKPNKEKILSVDLDGVLNYYPDCWVDFINRETGLNFKDKNEAKKRLPAKEYSSLKDKYRKSDFKANLVIREEALEILEYLKCKGYFILVVTSRPFEDYPSLAITTRKWLHKNNVPYDVLMEKSIDSFKKYPCLDFCIEDEIEDANLIAKEGYKVFLFEKQCNNELTHINVIRVKDLREIVDYLSE